MTPLSASSESAIHIYAIAVAYLRDAIIGNSGPVNAVSAQEVAPDIFYIGCQEEGTKLGRPRAPLAVCTYDNKAKVWRVELISGEVLSLVDRGKFWDPVENEKRSAESGSLRDSRLTAGQMERRRE